MSKEAMKQALDFLRSGNFVYPTKIAKDLEEALAKQEQGELVAYIHRNEYNEYRLEPHDDFDIKSIPFNVDVPLFKSPQQRTWVGLTDEEWDEMWIICGRPYLADWYNAAEAIEAKLKEKNT